MTNEQLGSGSAPSTCPTSCRAPTRDLVAAFTPLPLLIDAPGDVPRQEASDRRTLLLWFLHAHPALAWEPVIAEHRRRLERRPAWAPWWPPCPFIPTIPGTDTYTDQLWD